MGPLIIAPHFDDEVLGCATFLREEPTLLYMTHIHPAFPEGEMVNANKRLLAWLGKPRVIYCTFPGNDLDTAPQHKLLVAIEEAIKDTKPDTVLIPYPSFNQDHRAVYDAALAALRPHDTHHPVKRVLIYEQAEVLGTMRSDFRPTYFRPLDIDFKIQCLEWYPTIIRGHRNTSQLKGIARMRGYQVNIEYAEAFEVLRWMD